MADTLVRRLISEAQEINSAAAKLFSSRFEASNLEPKPTPPLAKPTPFLATPPPFLATPPPPLGTLAPVIQVDLTKPPPQIATTTTSLASANYLPGKVGTLPEEHWVCIL